MLKHPFSKVMDISPDGKEAWVLMMGHYSPDAVVAVPKFVAKGALSLGIKLADDYRAVILYLGPDIIPNNHYAFLPNGNFAFVIPVSNGANHELFLGHTVKYIRTMERVMGALQRSVPRDEVAFNHWKLICYLCSEFPEARMFFRDFEEFKRDVYAIRAMLGEQKLVYRAKCYRPTDEVQESYLIL